MFQGEIGLLGETGIDGDEGAKGMKGDVGAPGARGPPGEPVSNVSYWHRITNNSELLKRNLRTAWQKTALMFYRQFSGYFSVIPLIVSVSYLEILRFLSVIEIYIKMSEIQIFWLSALISQMAPYGNRQTISDNYIS